MTDRTVHLSTLGVLVMLLVAFIPDYAVSLFVSWLVLAAMHGLAVLLRPHRSTQ